MAIIRTRAITGGRNRVAPKDEGLLRLPGRRAYLPIRENRRSGGPRPEMIDRKSDCREAEVSGGKSRWMQRGVLATVCALVIGVYAYAARSGYVVSSSLDVADSYYNLLVQGFRAGQLNLKTAVPSGLAQLADPYDPVAHSPYPVDDMSYYKGKLYLYYGVTPAVLFFWPYVALTGDYLLQKDAAVVFCVVGFLASVYLLRAVWRRYFAEVSVAVVAAGALALGLVTCTPSLLARCDVWEVSISCGYAFTMLALATIWKALHHSCQRGRWLAAASLSYGLVVGARPSLIFGAAVLLVPVVDAWRERRRVWALLIAAIGPIALIGLGLMLYNFLRFDGPFEFGWRYQLAGGRQDTVHPFDLRYLWFNVRVYFLESARWSGRFPFVHDIRVPPLPEGQGRTEHPYGVLTNIPLAWLALAGPLAWGRRSAEARSSLCGFLTAVTLLFGFCALTLCLFFAVSIRYEVEFLPALVLLAVIGILSLERALSDSPVWRRVARWCWSLLLSFSVAFSLLASIGRRAEADNNLGRVLLNAGKGQDAIVRFEQAVRLQPDFAEAHNNLGVALQGAGQPQEAIGHYEQAVRLQPDLAVTHDNLGLALEKLGKVQEAISHWEQAVRIKSDYAQAHHNLGSALTRMGRVEQAVGHLEEAVRLRPDMADAQYDLGSALVQLGRVEQAVGHLEEAVRLRPDMADAQYDLGNALVQLGRVQEAIDRYQEAVCLKPDYAEAHYSLGRALLNAGNLQDAIMHFELALQINPDYAVAHNDLGAALFNAGNLQEAIMHFESALRIKPDSADARANLGAALLQQGKMPEAMEQIEQALGIDPDDAEAHYELAVALEKTGKIEDAIAHYERAVRIQPDFAEAQHRLARLRLSDK